MTTRTGGFRIGFRRVGSAWAKDTAALAKWAKGAGFEAIDLPRPTSADLAALKGAGVVIGSADLIEFPKLMSTDAGMRKDLIAQNVAYVKESAAAGVKVFFTCILPGDPAAKRSDNYKLAVETFGPIAEAAASVGAKIAIEGYPGSGPHFPALCCTPETCRTFPKDTNAKSVGFNYDPSHLIRLGVDHIRFLHEFVGQVYHVHGKDTEVMGDALYEYGLYQAAVFAAPHKWGANVWRYTLPGHGCSRWTEIFTILKAANYAGFVSVELEDEHFNGSEAGERAGFEASLAFLRSA